jgi:predicted SAM-dependent methyltransferase
LESCAKQEFQDFEVVVAPNNAALKKVNAIKKMVEEAVGDKGRVCPYTTKSKKTGEIKHWGFMCGDGDWLVELDHDDYLQPNCLRRLAETAAENPDATMLYSDAGYVNWERRFMNGCGWDYPDQFDHKLGKVTHIRQPGPLAQNCSRIYTAPDHVRVWRRDWYRDQGGHRKDLAFGDDFELCVRSYLWGKIVHIPECLYLYRCHDDQNIKKRNREVQDCWWGVYQEYIDRIAKTFADRAGLMKLDLGARINAASGYTTVDKYEGAHITADLEKKWPFSDNSVGVVRASDVFEHLHDRIHTMNELYRVLCHGGYALIRVPSTEGRGAFRDPTHVSYWNLESFWYYTKEKFNKFIKPQCDVRFQVLRLRNVEEHGILYTDAHLLAIKEVNGLAGPRFHGLLEI